MLKEAQMALITHGQDLSAKTDTWIITDGSRSKEGFRSTDVSGSSEGSRSTDVSRSGDVSGSSDGSLETDGRMYGNYFSLGLLPGPAFSCKKINIELSPQLSQTFDYHNNVYH